jgi:predicted amidohydrolase YtcJ
MAAAECLSKGVTSFQDAGSSFDTVDVIQEVAEQRGIPIRLWIMIRDSNANLQRLLPAYRTIDEPPGVTIRAVKRSLDGALGAHGAWLREPYDDMPSSAGLNTYPLNDLDETARIALRHNCQLCVHAIGDRANQETLDVFERHLAGDIARRWRIEHAQHLNEEDIPRFAQLGVIASMQGIHCTSDAVFVIQRLGLRRAGEGAYVWRKLLEAGAKIANGTDAPVEDVDPIACFHASVTRELSDGARFFPQQAMTRSEALKSYTIDAAYAAFEENEKGSLTPGKLADIVILSKNLLTCADDEIRDAQVQYTIVGGKVAYRRGE